MNPASIPAFPFIDSASPLEHPGMTLRDYFAAKALHALVVEPQWGEGGMATVRAWSADFTGSDSCARFAFAAYKMADAMLAARGTP
jgi:hypothetical protein